MILVTGATGNIGSEVVSLLLARGERVRVLVRDEKKVAHLGDRVERAVGDLTKPASLDAAMKGADKLFLLIAGEPGDVATQHAVDAAKRAGVAHVVLLSSGTVLIPGVKIGAWHQTREDIVARSGLPWTFVRPGAFMANTLRWADSIKAQGVVYQTHGDGRTAPIHEHDMAAVSVVALTSPGHEGQSYALTGPAPISPREQAAVLGRVLQRELRFVDVPEEKALEGMQRGGQSAEMAEAVMELMRLGASGREAHVTPWVETLTGHPARDYEAWAREHVAAFR